MAEQDEQDAVEIVRFLARHRSLIDVYAYTIIRDFQLVEDVGQEVAMVVAKQWKNIDKNGSLKPWLREVTRRKSLEAVRKARRQPVILSDEVLDRLGGYFDEGEDSERAGSIRSSVILRCMQKLTGVARRVVDARYRDGLECAKIAKDISRSVQGVYGILKRARVALASCIEAEVNRERAG